MVVIIWNYKKVEDLISRFIEWLTNHPTKGAMYMVVVYIIATVLMAPVSMLSVGTGYAF